MKLIALPLALSAMALASPMVTAASSRQGNVVIINGNQIAAAWRVTGQRLEVSDTALLYQIGGELLSTTNYRQQPVISPSGQRLTLAATVDRQHRYLDITKLAASNGWRWQAANNQLQLSAPGQVNDVQSSGLGSDRASVTVALDRALLWRLSQDATSGFLTIYGGAKATLRQSPDQPSAPASSSEPGDDQTITNTSFKVTGTDRQTVIQFPIKLGSRARAINQRGGIAIEISPTAMAERRVAWAPGVVWQQKWQTLGSDRFPVSLLELDPQKVSLRPIFGQSSVVGSGPIGALASSSGAAAAINGGYFNRNTRQPLGAVKIGGKWLSSPILGRGALGWQERGGWQIAPLTYSETIKDDRGHQVTNNLLNSGYIQGPTARYTSHWGRSYQPATSELVLTVQANRVTAISNGTETQIPSNGYLLVGRNGGFQDWTVGSQVQIASRSNPASFDRATNILGAGPWLLQKRQVVLNAQRENFTGSFGTQSASRSAIGINGRGQLQIVAVHARAGGKGPTLGELAQLLQQLGWVDALNLDGGSSTSMLLGGQLVDRSPATAAKVNNGLGIFLIP
jgi:hypothetical protein